MVELLKHPLTVLLVGALISGLLIPAWTRRWQSHQKALEIKTQLVGDLSKSIMGMVMAIQFAHLRAGSLEPAAFDKAYRDWEIESAVIGTKLQAYFPDTRIPAEWTAFAALVTEFYALEGVDADARVRLGADLARRLGVPGGSQGSEEWLALKNAILDRKSVLIRKVLETPVSVLG